MDIIKMIHEYAVTNPDRPAVISGNDSLTYGQLDLWSDLAAAYLERTSGEDHTPVAVYGHKHPYMLVCFLACVKSGRAYCPIDTSVPESRAEMILQMLESPVMFAMEPTGIMGSGKEMITPEKLEKIIADGHEAQQLKAVSGEDIFYIIFTSGSTGVPKGVQITADCLNYFLDWSVELGTAAAEKTGKVFLNQAPFSFDLSVMDLYTNLACGGTLWCLNKEVQKDYGALFESLHSSHAAVWVSTPSFAEVCLSDPQFTGEYMKELEVFLFCGETLMNKTAEKLLDRFPGAKVLNTYGPTESTVAVTGVEITRELCRTEVPLPVGVPKEGTRIEIQDGAGRFVPEGETGEIVILGDTVSVGYYQKDEQTRKVFFERNANRQKTRGYRTGDEGYLKGNMLYYCGRQDLQVKFHGYRIELGDIENHLLKLEGIRQAAVLPNIRDGKISSLNAFVKCDCMTDAEREQTKLYKEELKKNLPDYMIPKKFIYLDQMPVTNNGKTDRKALEERLS